MQLIVAGHFNFLGYDKMLISSFFAVPGIALLITWLVMDKKLKIESGSKAWRILGIGILVASLLVLTSSVVMTVILRDLLTDHYELAH